MCKSRKFLRKIVFGGNLFFGGMLLFSLVLPLVPPAYFVFSFLSIFTPIVLIINLLYFVFWLIFQRKKALFSGVLLLMAFPFLGRFFQISTQQEILPTDFRLMTFNVRVFNHFQWNSDAKLNRKIVDFIKEKHPNIVAIQEFHRWETHHFPFYKYKKIIYKEENDQIGQAILSDYPIINSGSLNFPNTSNNGVFADIVLKNDTIRLYNLHFESFHINPEEQSFSQEDSKRLFLNIGKRFERQQQQYEVFDAHRKESPFPIAVCGDFNNTAFSYLYRKMKSDNLNDAFQEAGNGFGKSFFFKYFPFRIDYVLLDKKFEVIDYQTFSKIPYSDHYPILVTFRSK